MYASMFVLFKGSSIWCFVASACDAELLIVKAASVAVSIPGVRPVLVLSNSQSFISLLSTIGVEFRGLLSDIMCCLCVMFAPILWCYISLLCFAMVAADVLAGLALLLLNADDIRTKGTDLFQPNMESMKKKGRALQNLGNALKHMLASSSSCNRVGS
ncbi:hypothetical protein F2Q69_00016163 [Brassica cretica]|uniref:Uncharacterized protein n=1 Tax=Brassica cretica TaxID=69181 RepID=A0A8S9QTE8_BRACR|nr:hypothetical protein F2Q69_00016163 [Brassica cretica]